MKKSRFLWQLVGFIFTGIAGSLLHFLYEWTGKSAFVAPFSAVNESIWEHMKLLFVPLFLFALVQNFFLIEAPENFWCVKLIGILSGVLSIPVLYYTYTGIFGKSLDWVNIIIFFLAAAISYTMETKLFQNSEFGCNYSILPLLLLCVLALTFVILTYIPPEIPLFADPRTGTYGVKISI